MPILRQLVPGSFGSKRRSRADLTVEMISAPLADFRHTMHIGRGGDAFGDTSFLSADYKTIHRVQKNGLLLHKPTDKSYMLTANCHNRVSSVSDQEVTQRTSVGFPESSRSLEEVEQCLGNPAKPPMFTPPPSRAMKPAESMLSFHIDLGPSILRDVLGVMDQSEHFQQNLTSDQTGRQQDWKTPSFLECVSTSSSGEMEYKTQFESQIFRPTCGVNINHKDFLFMDEDEEEIRV